MRSRRGGSIRHAASHRKVSGGGRAGNSGLLFRGGLGDLVDRTRRAGVTDHVSRETFRVEDGWIASRPARARSDPSAAPTRRSRRRRTAERRLAGATELKLGGAAAFRRAFDIRSTASRVMWSTAFHVKHGADAAGSTRVCRRGALRGASGARMRRSRLVSVLRAPLSVRCGANGSRWRSTAAALRAAPPP